MKKLLMFFAVMNAWAVSAQNELDILRASMHQTQGTAKSMGMGNSLGAIGNDLSIVSQNPAAAGTFLTSQFTFNFGGNFNNVQAIHYGQRNNRQTNRTQIGNWGIVWTNPVIDQTSRVKFWNFSISSTKLADFNRTTVFEGANPDNSLIDVHYNNLLYGTFNDFPFTSQLSYNVFVIDEDESGNLFNAVPIGDNLQKRSINETGSLRQTDLALGFNIDNQFFLGVSVGIMNIDYSSTIDHTEVMDESLTDNPLLRFDFSEFLDISGTGLNLKVGGIWHVDDKLRLGAHLHSPTSFFIEEEYSTEMTSEFRDGFRGFTQSLPELEFFTYSMRNPWRYGASAAYIINRKLIVSGEVESVAHNSGRFFTERKEVGSFEETNRNISTNLSNAINARLGIEYRRDHHFFRAGGGYNSNPWRDGGDVNWQVLRGSFGYGISFKKLSLDFAYSTWFMQDDLYLYNNDAVVEEGLKPLQRSKAKINNSSFLIGLSFRL